MRSSSATSTCRLLAGARLMILPASGHRPGAEFLDGTDGSAGARRQSSSPPLAVSTICWTVPKDKPRRWAASEVLQYSFQEIRA
jgi:hypothetical protein